MATISIEHVYKNEHVYKKYGDIDLKKPILLGVRSENIFFTTKENSLFIGKMVY